MYRDKYDLIVVGSGPGGFAAAIAAARKGVSTLLVERNGQVGGLLTSGLPLLAFLDRAGNQVVGGIEPRLDEHWRGVDDKRVHALVVFHHAQHTQHATPGVAEQMEVIETERLAHGVVLVYPQIVGVVVLAHVLHHGLAAADLVVEN